MMPSGLGGAPYFAWWPTAQTYAATAARSPWDSCAPPMGGIGLR